MVEKRIFKWLTLDMMVFIALNAVLIPYFGNRLESLAHIDALRLFVLGLAVYRASNIISNEVVTKPLRAPFVNEVEENGKTVEKPKPTGFLGATGLLIYCPSCTGVWISALLVYAYALRPGPTFVVALFLALSGMERIYAGLLGWFKTAR